MDFRIPSRLHSPSAGNQVVEAYLQPCPMTQVPASSSARVQVQDVVVAGAGAATGLGAGLAAGDGEAATKAVRRRVKGMRKLD